MLDWLTHIMDTTTLAGTATVLGAAAGAGRRPSPSAASASADEPKFATLFHVSPLPLILTAEDTGLVLEVNVAAEALAGRPAGLLRGASLMDIGGYDDPADRARHLEAVREGAGHAARELRLRTPSGHDLRLLAHTTRVTIDGERCLLTALTNVTALSHLDERLLYAQRMEVIGRLSGGVAHEFNNLLTVMQGHLDALGAELPPALPAMQRVETLRRAVAEAARITSGLLTFAGRNPSAAALADVNAVLDDLAPVLAGLLGDAVRLEWDRADAPVPVTLGQPQLAQLVLNLALNARDAMPGGGRLTIATRGVELDGAAEPGPGSWIVLTLADNGHGMSDDVRLHMFEPFFTTKHPGRGSGLGLSICLGIVEQIGGHIVARSSPGLGTTIDLYLPRAGADARPAVQARTLHPAPSRRTAILLVEDEPDVRDIVAEILRRAGHTVQAVGDLAGARALLGRGDRVDLLLTDLVLPDGSGLDVAARLRADRPGVPVLFMSGYSEAVFSGGERVEHLLPKPFTSKTLLAKVDEMTTPRQHLAAS